MRSTMREVGQRYAAGLKAAFEQPVEQRAA